MAPDGVGPAIRDGRRRAGMTREQLAVLVGVAPDTVDGWERGELLPDDGQVQIVSEALGIDGLAAPPVVSIEIEPPAEAMTGSPHYPGFALLAVATALALVVAIAGVVVAGREHDRVAQLRGDVASVEAALSAARAQRSVLDQRLDDLAATLAGESHRADTAEERLAREQLRNEELENELRGRISVAAGELDRLSGEVERLSAAGDALVAETRRLAAENRRLIDENRFLRSAVVVSRASGDLQLVALTLDDGGSADANRMVLDTLATAGVSATLFPSGENVAAFPDLWRRAVADGHELGNHTQRHLGVTEISIRELDEQLAGWEESVEAALGADYDARWFRPPYMLGFEDLIGPADVRDLLAERGYITALWDVETYYALYAPSGPRLAGSSVSVSEVVDYVVGAAGPGSVILLHFGPTDAAALAGIIDGLRAKGLEPVSLSELFAAHQAAMEAET